MLDATCASPADEKRPLGQASHDATVGASGAAEKEPGAHAVHDAEAPAEVEK